MKREIALDHGGDVSSLLYATPPSPVEVGRRPPGGYLTPAFLGARKWAEMLPNPCILGGPQQRGQNFRASSARPYVWPVAIDPW